MTLGLLPEVSGASVLQAVSNNITAALAKYFAMLPGWLSGNVMSQKKHYPINVRL